MNNAIYKYQLSITETQNLELPIGAEILTAQNQHETACIWVFINKLQTTKETRTIKIFGTGQIIKSENLKYISTIQLDGGAYVFHIFEQTN